MFLLIKSPTGKVKLLFTVASGIQEIVACEHEISANGLQPRIEQVSTGILLTMLG